MPQQGVDDGGGDGMEMFGGWNGGVGMDGGYCCDGGGRGAKVGAASPWPCWVQGAPRGRRRGGGRWQRERPYVPVGFVPSIHCIRSGIGSYNSVTVVMGDDEGCGEGRAGTRKDIW